MVPYILGAVSLVLAGFLIYSRYKKNVAAATFFKCLASLFFVAMGIVAYLQNQNRNEQLLLMLLGLGFGMVGDAILQMKSIYPKKFITFVLFGMGGFFFGHVFYIISVTMRYGFSPFSLILPVVGVVAMFFNLKRYDMSGAQSAKYAGLFYYFTLMLFVASSVNSAISAQSVSTILLAVGSIFFAVSDTILVESYFGKKSFKLTLWNLTTYYLAQVLIAISIILY